MQEELVVQHSYEMVKNPQPPGPAATQQCLLCQLRACLQRPTSQSSRMIDMIHREHQEVLHIGISVSQSNEQDVQVQHASWILWWLLSCTVSILGNHRKALGQVSVGVHEEQQGWLQFPSVAEQSSDCLLASGSRLHQELTLM